MIRTPQAQLVDTGVAEPVALQWQNQSLDGGAGSDQWSCFLEMEQFFFFVNKKWNNSGHDSKDAS